MRRSFSAVLTLCGLVSGFQGAAQTHKVAKPEQVVRAVGVYEWTGELKKPDGSRLVPVTVFIDGAIEDAGVYLPRPIPFALTPGNEYELQQAGVARGALDLAYARHLQTADLAYEDGWFGYGNYKAPAAAKKDPVLRASRNPAVLTSSKDDARPHLSDKSDVGAAKGADSGDTGKNPTSTTDKDGTEKTPETSPGTSSGSTSSVDPDRPTIRRRSGSSTHPSDTPPPSDTRPPVADDPDRPTLRRRSPDEAKKSKEAANGVAAVTGTGSLNNDPDRPKLQRGGRSAVSDTDTPKLVGVPKDLHQMVAVSDPVNRPPHDFARPWQDDAERAEVLRKMQSLARAQLQTYGADPLRAGETPTKPVQSSSPGTAVRHPAGRPTRSTSAPAPKASTPLQIPLLDEELKAYTLSYGGAPTYVYTAHTAGTGADLRYVTIVAQADVSGDLKPVIRSATDEAHLDRSPRMRFIDVVDVEASNRASMLFELRAQSSRQFALSRVIGARADTIFTSGTTQ